MNSVSTDISPPPAFLDIHCHCLGGLDDGPGSLAESVELCRALVEDGVCVVVATPHQLGRYELMNRTAIVRSAVSELNAALKAAGIQLEVLPGADIRIDERIKRFLDDGELTTVGDKGGAVLLELPHEVYVDPAMVIRQLVSEGKMVLMTHPERYPYLQRRPNLVEAMLEEGAMLQLTAGSLIGDFGPAAQAAAWDWLRRGWGAVVASDAHNLDRRPPRMTRAFSAIEMELGRDAALRLCVTNPHGVLSGHVEVGPAVHVEKAAATHCA